MSTRAVIPILAAALVGLCGCETIQDTFGGRASDDPNRTADVRVHNPETDQDVDVKVFADRGNEDSVKGVKALQTRDWGDAANFFAAALKTDPKSYNSAFGLAVAQEKMSQYEKAIASYKAANYINSTQANLDGIKRCEDALNN